MIAATGALHRSWCVRKLRKPTCDGSRCSKICIQINNLRSFLPRLPARNKTSWRAAGDGSRAAGLHSVPQLQALKTATRDPGRAVAPGNGNWTALKERAPSRRRGA